MESTATLSKDNYQEHDDLSIFPTDQLVSLFTSIPKIKTLSILRGFEQNFILRFLDDCPEHLSAQWKTSLKFKFYISNKVFFSLGGRDSPPPITDGSAP